MSKLLYLDNAATTKTAPEVVEAMLPYFTEKFGNPSSVYSFAAANKEVINQQRDAIAEMIGAKSNEIYFTGGGSESDNCRRVVGHSGLVYKFQSACEAAFSA